MEIAESANAPDTQPCDSRNWSAHVEFEAKDNWKVVIFYDCGNLDYIDHFITPDGEIIDYWDWPDGEDFYTSDKNLLMCWCGNGDIERLRSNQANSANKKNRATD